MLSFIPAALLALALSYNVTKDDVRRLLNAGLTEQTIVEFIRRNAPAEPLSVEDITELKAVGATDKVITAMLEASRTSEAVKPSTSTGDYPSTTTYTYSYPQYSYSPYYSSYYSPYYYPSYSYYYPGYYYPRSYYYPHSYYRPYYYSQRYPYRNYHYPNSVSPYRNPQQHHVRPQQQMQPRPQPTQPRQGTGTYRR